MDEFGRRVLTSQMLASLDMLEDCIRRCPEEEFHQDQGDYPFSQTAFHALFFCDLYLSDRHESFFAQDFHRLNSGQFEGYEEMKDQLPQKTYPRDFLLAYLEHCREKVREVLSSMEPGDFEDLSSLRPRPLSRLELVLDNIRHVQHHASQLGLRLQFLAGQEMDWVERGRL